MKNKPLQDGFKKIDKTDVGDLESYIYTQLGSDRAAIAGEGMKISVGTDSKFHPRKGGYSVTYGTIVAFTFGKNGTHLIMRREILKGDGKLSLFDRLWQEVQMSVDLAMWIRDNASVEVEVHLDVNPKRGAGSNVLHDAAKGYVESLGFVCECKPTSPIAACASDHFVRNKMVL